MMYRKLMAVVAVLAALLATAGPAGADPQGFIEDDLGVGFFYGTFDQSQSVMLLAGGTAEEFCHDNPDDPFNAEPGIAPLRIFPRHDGSVDLNVNDKGQPIHLYYTDHGNSPVWIGQVCAELAAGGAAPVPFASGTADLKVRVSLVSEDLIEVFNSVNGIASGSDGSTYKVKAWADLVVENGMPVGNPEDFVGFRMTQIRR